MKVKRSIKVCRSLLIIIDYDNIKKHVLNPLEISAEPDNSGEETKIEEARKKVGEKKWEEVLKKCGVDGRLIKSLQSDAGFNSLKPEDMQKINSCITKKIQSGNKKAEDYISGFHEKEITVRTISGRLLFTAKQRK